MKTLNNNTENIIYFIAWSEGMVHYGILNSGETATTGQPNVEEFADEAAWLLRLGELGITIEEEVEPPYVEPPKPLTDKQRLIQLEEVTEEIIVNLNEKGIIP